VEKSMKIEELEIIVMNQNEEFVELKTWAKYDEIAHDYYTKELMSNGMTKHSLSLIESDMEYQRKLAGNMKNYYTSVLTQSDL
jgi:hypothetical protein